MKVSVFKPGYLVSLKSKVRGGVSYDKTPVEEKQIEGAVEGQVRTVQKRTVKVTFEDKEEHDAAEKLRGQLDKLIRSVCVDGEFVLLCAPERIDELKATVAEAQRRAAEFTAAAKYKEIKIVCDAAKLAESDSEATRALAEELRETLDKMREAVYDGDVKAARDAASAASKLAASLEPSLGDRVGKAVEDLRAGCRKITKEFGESAGRDAEAYARFVQNLDFKSLEREQFAFLDVVAEPVSVSVGGADNLPSIVPATVDMGPPEGEGEGESDGKGEDLAAAQESAPVIDPAFNALQDDVDAFESESDAVDAA